MAVEIRLQLDQAIGENPVRKTLTGVAVFDGTQWASLCREYDVASVGGTAGGALLNLQDAVREAVATAAEKDLSPGRPVSDAELRRFMLSHLEGQGSAAVVRFTI